MERSIAAQTLKSEVGALKTRRILEAAAELFADQGYHNASMGDIAKQLGMTKPFIYSYFKDKNALLYAICRQGIDLSASALEKAESSEAAAEDRLKGFFRAFAGIVIENKTFVTVYGREIVNLTEEQARDILTTREQIDKRFTSWLTDLHQQKIIDVPNPKITATTVTMMLGTLWAWYTERPDAHKEAFIETIVELASRMVGIKLEPS